jgi:hypothetical protein
MVYKAVTSGETAMAIPKRKQCKVKQINTVLWAQTSPIHHITPFPTTVMRIVHTTCEKHVETTIDNVKPGEPVYQAALRLFLLNSDGEILICKSPCLIGQEGTGKCSPDWVHRMLCNFTSNRSVGIHCMFVQSP